ncbi:MAG: AzlD domain-containing protein [Victivallales bacterium]|nr:AzlD domain-containing protein [Victivallales bacterium]
MNQALYLICLVLVTATVTFLLRAFPFLAFGHTKNGHTPQIVSYLGRMVSPAAIAMLVVYCYCSYFQGHTLPEMHYGIAELAAGIVVVLLQLWRRNPLLSILAGTALYMLLVQKLLC